MFSGQATCCNNNLRLTNQMLSGLLSATPQGLPFLAASSLRAAGFPLDPLHPAGRQERSKSVEKAPLPLVASATGDAHHFCLCSISLHSMWPYLDSRGAEKWGHPGRRGSGFDEHMGLRVCF